MQGYGLRFGATVSLSCPVGVTTLAQIIEMIMIERNNARATWFTRKREPLMFVNMPDPLNPEVQWVGVTAPYMQGMLLLHEPYSSEYGLIPKKFYTEVGMTYLGTGRPLSTFLPQEDEQQFLSELRLFGRFLPKAVSAAQSANETIPSKTA